MRTTVRRLASELASTGLSPRPSAILPPIPLYRRLLRAHRKFLPKEMRLLGDEYIRAEFRAHRNVDNPAHLVSPPARTSQPGFRSPVLQIGFLTEWQLYAQKIEGDSWVGEKLDAAKIEKMSGASSERTSRLQDIRTDRSVDEQLAQLYELMKAIQKRGEEGENVP